MSDKATVNKFDQSIPGLVSLVIFMLSQIYYIIFFLNAMVLKYSDSMEIESLIGMMKSLGTYGSVFGVVGIAAGTLAFLPSQRGKKRLFAYIGMGMNTVVLVVSLLFALAARA